MTLRALFNLRLPRRFLRGSVGSLSLTVIALTCGVALVCAMDLVNRAVLRAFVEVVDTMAGRAALSVSAGGAPFPESMVERVTAVAGVQLAVAVVGATAFTADESGELMTVHGVDVANDAAVRVYEGRDAAGLELADPLVFLNQPDSIVITRAFAKRRAIGIDDHLELLTPTGRGTFTVRGLLNPEGIARAYGGNLIVMDLPAAQSAFLQPGFVNRIDVVIQPDARVPDVGAAIAAVLPEGLHVESPSQRKADLNQVMQALQVMLQAVSLIGLAAAFLIIFNRLTTVFEGRAWQLGVLRAVGMRAKTMWWELSKESLLLGSVGVVLGIPLGIVGGRLLLPVVATTAALNFKLIATPANLTVGPRSLIVALLLGLGAAFLAAAVPAWRVSMRPPVETIRGRGAPSFACVSRAGWILRLVVVAGAIAVIAAQRATRDPTWGLAATALIAIATVLAAQPFLNLVSGPFLQALRSVLGPTAELARATLSSNNPRAVLTTAMIGVGLGAIIWLRMLAYSFETSLVHALSGALQGDWVVSSSHVSGGYLEAPVSDQLVKHVVEISGIEDAVGERLVDWIYRGEPIGIDALDSRYFTTAAFGHWPLIRGNEHEVQENVRTGTAVLVSSGFALNLGVDVGDTLSVETPNGPLTVSVAGITVNFAAPRGTIVMSRDLYRTYWGDRQVNRVFVRAKLGVDPTAARDHIARALGAEYGLRIISAADLMDYFAVQVRRAFAPVDVLAVLMLVVLLVGLADTLAASVLERTRELGVTRTLGVRRALLGRAVVAEALGLGAFGILLSLAAGLSLGALWVRGTFPFLLGWALETYVPVAQIVSLGAATLAVCAVAGLPPALRAAALRPADALRCE